ncbi:hypothetical protein NDU88_002003 [Pleurodeles waltl]|uniref:Uncharacterized protein n=1 Tax=Pleurodeles waltl TaxID=8319 RepID=A0AAV7NCR9_PLEWA|nr:hypothetical protein NDU88_002003 [Pleurodeles waltl]
MIFPDFTKETQAQRATFNESKRTLRENVIEYAMLFPAKRRVENEGKAQFFLSPQLVEEWLETLNLTNLPPPSRTLRKPGRKRSRSFKRVTEAAPPRQQSHQERRDAVDAAAALSGGKCPQSRTSGSVSDPDSSCSDSSISSQDTAISLPKITPGTSEEII